MADPTLLDRCVDAWRDATPWTPCHAGISAVIEHLAAEVIAAQQITGRPLSGDDVARMLLAHDEPQEPTDG
jgi:hypothetical protein